MSLRRSRGDAVAASVWVAGALRKALGTPEVESLEPSSYPEDWDVVGPAIARHRVAGTLSPMLARIDAPAEIVERVRAQHVKAVSDGLRVAHDTVRASNALREAGIAHLVVKGVALAALVGDDIASRGAGDVDIWVRPADVPEAERALASQGWQRRYDAQLFPSPEHRRRWHWLLREMNEIPLAHATCADVDLHWRLGQTDAEVSFEFDSALHAASTVDVGNTRIDTLAPLHALEHLAQHARKEAWPNLRSIQDIVQVSRSLDGSEVKRLAATNRNVRIAVGLGSRLDQNLSPLVDLDRSDRRLVDEAWLRCLGGQSWPLVQPQSSGWTGIRRWLDHNSWLWRSSPSWKVRWWFLSRGVMRARVFFDLRRRPWAKGVVIGATRAD